MEDAPMAYSVRSLVVTTDEATLTIKHYQDGSDASYTDQYTWFADDETTDGEVAVSESTASGIADAVNYLSWLACVDPSWDGSTNYGLSSPTLTATLEYVSSTSEDVEEGEVTDETLEYFTLVVGDQVEGEDAYYAQPEGSSKVYTISASVVEKLTGTKVEDMLPDDVLLMDWTEVTSMEVSTGGVTKTIDFEHTRSEDDGDGDGEADIETAYTVDGQECDASEVEELLDALDALETEDVVQDAEPAEAAVRIVIYRDTETYSEMELSLSRYDNSFYLVTFNGASRLLVNRVDVEAVIEAIEAL